MTECNTTTVDFTPLGRRQVVADFLGGRLTSDAGALLLREVDRRSGLLDAIDEAIPDPRDPRYTVPDQRAMLAQRIISLALGDEDLHDQQTMRLDPALQTVAGCSPETDQPLASPSTLCRRENRITRATLLKLSAVLVEKFLDSFQDPPEEITLDFDATDDRVHGNQEKRFFHGYYKSYCFLPLYVFCGDQLLCAYLRPSNIDGAKHVRAITKLLVVAIRKRWPDVKITIRADSGLLLSSFAYVLVETLRREHLDGTGLAQAQVDTIRWKLFKVAARVITSVRRVVLHLSSSYPGQDLFRRVVASLMGAPQAHPSPG